MGSRVNSWFELLFGIQTKGLQLLPLAQQQGSSYSLLLGMAGLVNIDLSLMKIFLSNVDFATLQGKIQIIHGLPVWTLMGSGMLFAIYTKMIRAVFHLINPMCGQSHNWFSFLGTIKWTSCLLTQGHNNKLHIHMKLSHWSKMGDWHSILLFAGALHEHSIVSHLSQTNKL